MQRVSTVDKRLPTVPHSVGVSLPRATHDCKQQSRIEAGVSGLVLEHLNDAFPTRPRTPSAPAVCVKKGATDTTHRESSLLRLFHFSERS